MISGAPLSKTVLSLAAFFLVAAGCGPKEEPGPVTASQAAKSEPPSQEGWNSSIVLTKAGRKQAVIRYAHMAKYDNRRTAYFDGGVEVDFYDAYGKHTSHLTSERGVYYEDTEDVTGEGKVVVVSDTGITLRTERLVWDHGTETIRSDTAVVVTTPKGDTLVGIGFQSDADLNRWTIQRPKGFTKRRIDFDAVDSSMTKTGKDSS